MRRPVTKGVGKEQTPASFSVCLPVIKHKTTTFRQGCPGIQVKLTNNMKKLVMMAVVLMMSVAAMAQSGTQAVGVGVNLGTKSGYSPIGIGAKYQNEFVKNIRGEVAFNYYFPKDYLAEYDVDVNFHYLFQLAPSCNFYPAVGLAYETLAWTGDAKEALKAMGAKTSDSGLGINLGGGIEYYLGNSMKVNAEVKYQSNIDWLTIGVGIAYVF